jgi:hypothetical protein
MAKMIMAYYVMALSVWCPVKFVQVITPDPLCKFEAIFHMVVALDLRKCHDLDPRL